MDILEDLDKDEEVLWNGDESIEQKLNSLPVYPLHVVSFTLLNPYSTAWQLGPTDCKTLGIRTHKDSTTAPIQETNKTVNPNWISTFFVLLQVKCSSCEVIEGTEVHSTTISVQTEWTLNRKRGTGWECWSIGVCIYKAGLAFASQQHSHARSSF